ncbi:MAG TPA: phosphate ABC transporter ATP-binding protein PstB [Pseudonocardiaceae bacterium]|nr:phosphate ABC transporter ATP-binding protein PstB [Pseudonocardiaceae bacterium]
MSIQADPPGSGSAEESPAAQAEATRTVTATTTSSPNGAVAMTTVDLTLSFGKRAVLSDIGVDFSAGMVTALLGPTGSGKTTLLRTLNRMNDKVTGYHHDGDVLLDGRSIWNSGLELMTLRRKVGMLFQRPNPFPMSIMDNVIAGVKAHKMAPRAQLRDIAERRLRDVGLWDAVSTRLKDSPFRLSGGQQQLLCLARALAIDPDVLLLDEPTSSLDPVATESIEALLRTLVPDITVIIVTHNLAQARRVSDQTVFLNKGRLVEHGDTTQLFEHPKEEETAHYVTGRFG